MANQWYYAKGGQRHGPVNDQQLKKLAASGQLQRAILLGLIVLGMICPLSKADDLRVVLGKQEVIMPAGHLGLTFFPDQPICVLNKAPLTFLMTVGNATFLLAGPSWRTATHNGKVLEPGGPGTFDNGYAGIGGVLIQGYTVYGFYHAEDHENKASSISERRGQIPGMFSVGLAISQDGGRRFRKIGQVLTSSRPYEAGKECGGVGDISVCLDKTNTYLFAFYVDFARTQGKGVQICMARSPVAERGMPGTWRKYYNGRFDEPGLGGRESYVVSAHEKNADAYSPCAVYSKELDRYLLVFCWVDGSETDGVTYFKTAKTSGIYLATSRDGVKWEEPQQLFAYPTLLIRNSAGVQHPTLYLTGRKGRAVTGLLLYGYTPKWGSTVGGKFVPGTPHHLVGRTVTILPKDAPNTSGDKVTAASPRKETPDTTTDGTTIARSQPSTPTKPEVVSQGNGPFAAKKDPAKIRLFDGRDLEGGSVLYLNYSKSRTNTSWRAAPERGVLVSTGGDFNDLRTDRTFKDFTLTLEWRFTLGGFVGANGSGIIVRSNGLFNGLDPRGVEIDLRPGKNEEQGMGTGCFITYGTTLWNHRGFADGVKNRHLGWLREPEVKTGGQWNTCEITCKGDRIRVAMNGVLVNEGWGADIVAGGICLRNQNTAVEFRNVLLIPED